MCRCGGSGWTAARIGAGAPGDSLRIWPLVRALHLTCPRGAGPGLARRVDLIRSLSARWRDPSQMCHPATPPRPVPTLAQTWKETRGRMTMLTETIDAVIGIGTHRDSHEVEIAEPVPGPREGKSGPIDARLAVLAALRLDASRLPVPRAGGDREALRILLVAPAATGR